MLLRLLPLHLDVGEQGLRLLAQVGGFVELRLDLAAALVEYAGNGGGHLQIDHQTGEDDERHADPEFGVLNQILEPVHGQLFLRPCRPWRRSSPRRSPPCRSAWRQWRRRWRRRWAARYPPPRPGRLGCEALRPRL